MFRFVASTVLFMSASLAVAETDAERVARCESQGYIVSQAVEMRDEGKRAKRATRTLLKDELIAGTPNEKVVDVLVNWVYSLPQDQLTDEALGAFVEQCSAYTQ